MRDTVTYVLLDNAHTFLRVQVFDKTPFRSYLVAFCGSVRLSSFLGADLITIGYIYGRVVINFIKDYLSGHLDCDPSHYWG